jgi:hypothetical protein
MSSVMLWVGGLMVLMPILFAGALLGAMWRNSRRQNDGVGSSEQKTERSEERTVST